MLYCLSLNASRNQMYYTYKYTHRGQNFFLFHLVQAAGVLRLHAYLRYTASLNVSNLSTAELR